MAEKNTPEEPQAESLDIFMAAMIAAGPRDWIEDNDGERPETGEEYAERISAEVPFVISMLRQGSPVMRMVKRFEGSKVFPANIVGVSFNKKAQRPEVELEVKPSRWAKSGEETMRGMRVDVPGGKALYGQLKKLVDRRVLIHKGFEENKNDPGGKPYKQIIAVEDIGEAEDFDEDD